MRQRIGTRSLSQGQNKRIPENLIFPSEGKIVIGGIPGIEEKKEDGRAGLDESIKMSQLITEKDTGDKQSTIF